jgi:hypothetical protein
VSILPVRPFGAVKTGRPEVDVSGRRLSRRDETGWDEMGRSAVTRLTGAVALGTASLGTVALLAAPAAASGVPVPVPDLVVPAPVAEVAEVAEVAAESVPAPAPSPSDDPVTALLPEPVKGIAAPVVRPVMTLVLGAPEPTPAPRPTTTQAPAAPKPAVTPVPVRTTTRALPRTDVVAAAAPAAAVRLPRVDDTPAEAQVPSGGPRTAPLTLPRPVPPAVAQLPLGPSSPALPAAVVAVAIAMVSAAGAGQLAEMRARR